MTVKRAVDTNVIYMKGSEHHGMRFSSSNEIFKNQLHIISAVALNGGHSVKNNIKQAMKRFGYKSAMFSMIWMYKEHCITKENFDIEYGITKTEEEKFEESYDYSEGDDLLCLLDEDDRRKLDRLVELKHIKLTKSLIDQEIFIEYNDYSVGEDLEKFIRRIKNEEITTQTIPEDGEFNNSHLLCLLDKDERRKLDTKDQDFLKTFLHTKYGNDADVPEDQWQQTEFKHLKFSKSWAGRRTIFIDVEDEPEDEWIGPFR